MATTAGRLDQASTALSNTHTRITDAIKLNDPYAVMGVYNSLAHRYDEDVVHVNYTGPEAMVDVMNQFITDKSAKVLDIGAGTGILGTALHRSGYSTIDAAEPSQAMVDEAKKLGIYQRQIVDFIGTNRLDINEDTYDVITGSGVFCPGHIPVDALDELNRITKQGGLLFIMCSERYYGTEFDSYGENLDKKIEEKIVNGVWTLERKAMGGYREHYKCYITVVRKI